MREFLKVALAIMLSLSFASGALAQGYSPPSVALPVSAPNGGTGITDSGTDTSYFLGCDGDHGFVMGQPGGGGGGVSSVGMTGDNIIFNTAVTNSPITSSGSLVPTLKTVTANFGLFGPTTGSAATPTYRALVLADFPTQAQNTVLGSVTSGSHVPVALTATQLTTIPNIATTALQGMHPAATSGQVAIGQASGSIAAETISGDLTLAASGATTLATVNSNVGSFTNASVTVNAKGLVTAASSGTAPVTSVGLSLPADFTISNSPVTSTGTLTAVYANQTANTVLAGPTTGSPATPAYRALVAADIPLSLPTTNLSALTYLTEPTTAIATTPYTIATSDATNLLYSGNSGNGAWTLPDAASNVGRVYIIRNASSVATCYTLTVSGGGSNTINSTYQGSVATITLRCQEGVTLLARASGNWQMLSQTCYPFQIGVSVTTTTDYSASPPFAQPSVINADASGGAVSITPVDATRCGVGRSLTITNTGASGTVTVVGTFNGVSGISLPNQWDTVTIYSNGTNWTVAKHSNAAGTGIAIAKSGGVATFSVSGSPSIAGTYSSSNTATNALDLTGVNGGIRIASGSNGRIGTFTLSGGTVAVSNTGVTANTKVLFFPTSTSAALGAWDVESITASTGFTINSTNLADANTGWYLLIEAN